MQESTHPFSERRFRHLLEAAPDAIIEVDADGCIVLMNAATEQLFGYCAEELIGQNVDILVPDSIRARHAEHREDYCAHPLTRPMGSGRRLQAQRKDGSRFPVEISLSPYESEGEFRIGAIIRDASERIKAEEQILALHDRYTGELMAANRQLEVRNQEIESANQLKSEFLASMSHELRTPLHTIIGFAELLSEGNEGTLSGRQLRFVNHILRDGRHLLELINDILDLSKIESGRLELNLENFDWTLAVTEVLETIWPQAESRKVKIPPVELAPGRIYADRVRFKEILYNLLSNAVKFTPPGGSVYIEPTQNDRLLTISVRDTGIGIPKDKLERIFDKFYQTGMTTKGIREGTGLGLAITKHLVERHGGVLSVGSSVGVGSTFTFAIPLDGHEYLPFVPLPKNVTATPSERLAHIGGHRVLVVDDEKSSLHLMQEVLAGAGFLAILNNSAREALETLSTTQVSAVIADLMMPGMDGLEFIFRIREDPRLQHLPLLVLTAKELSAQEFEVLRRETRAMFLKGTNWREDLVLQLRRLMNG
ncbi:MAG: PAS domain S-box protein [Bryobacteraceae bacterium]|nr:PAS domain S-box protein [Bryobacteraceae bacterium]